MPRKTRRRFKDMMVGEKWRGWTIGEAVEPDWFEQTARQITVGNAMEADEQIEKEQPPGRMVNGY